MAHEYQHLLHFAHDVNLTTLEQVWVNEGLSEVTSDITGYGPQSGRLNQFSSVNGNSLTSWNSSSPLTDYAHTYVYFRFLLDSFGSTEILTRIFASDKNGISGVDEALLQMNDPNLIAGCGTDMSPSFTSFDCTFRYMWSSLLGFTAADGDRGGTATTDLFSRPANYSLGAQYAPDLPPPVATANVNLNSYAAELHSKVAVQTARLNDPGPCCDISDFTLFYRDLGSGGQNRFLVYNHNPVATSPSQINVISPNMQGGSAKTGGFMPEELNKPYETKPIPQEPIQENQAACGHVPFSNDALQALLD